MDYTSGPRPLPSSVRCSLQCVVATCIAVLLCAGLPSIGTVSGQPQQSRYQSMLLNTPPILYVAERNWRIPETAQVGQIIANVRADDAENDDLVFGLEPHFSSAGAGDTNNLPFRIDTVTGVVYLNESLVGRAGENIFLYITVSDGQLTAKNEVFVNILRHGETHKKISNFVHNISQIFPRFENLPGVQSAGSNWQKPSISLPPGFNMYGPHFHPPAPPRPSIWPTGESSDDHVETTEATLPTTYMNRTKLTPINSNSGKNHTITQNPSSSAENHDKEMNNNKIDDATNHNSNLLTTVHHDIILIVIGAGSLVLIVAAVCGLVHRKRLCLIGKKIKMKSKEEMAKKSNQSNLSNSTLTDDSRNSMVLQHWNGPTAYGNRYVPWERDHQLADPMSNTTSHFLSGVSNGAGNQLRSDNTTGGPPSTLRNGINGAMQLQQRNINESGNGSGKGDTWEFPRHRLKFFNILGEGAFGQVWRCEATDVDGNTGVTTVAVKTLKENATEVEKKDLVSELEVMKMLEPHANVVRLLGCCTEKDPIFAIIEYVNRGKLQTYLRDSRAERHYGNTHGKSDVLTSGNLTSFMYQVAKGMDYLTSRGIIHRDLAARNVLITDDHTCKVADFGFARDIVTSKIYERKSDGKLPIRWMAVESLYDNVFSVKSDVWSFGILMWEIVTLGSTPYPGISAADVMRKVRDGYRLEKPEHCRRELYNIMFYCWSKDEKERPTFSEIVQMLDKLLHTEMDYIELERFPDHNYYNVVNVSGEKL